MTTTTAAATAIATRQGTDGSNADGARVYESSSGVTAAAVIDGIGHAEDTVALVPALAEAAVRTAAARGPLAGLLGAGLLIADRGPTGAGPNAVGATVTVQPDGRTIAAWAGDVRVYGWDGDRLRQYTTDQTIGEQLRGWGIPAADAGFGDHIISVQLARATVATVPEVVIPATEQLVIVTTDGVHDYATHEELEDAVRDWRDGDLQRLADAIVAVTSPDPEGYRDDATVAVLSTQANAQAGGS
ncbi:PP2C family serine/threonine-protein phosphatase [Streptomyces sp. NPDC052069]|uniref:PP2C family serine/threonine-protein phosphatase n=1 Tax=Streptomyces sp. NPDC052069 TaxID=3154650 RepID=UPI00344A9627